MKRQNPKKRVETMANDGIELMRHALGVHLRGKKWTAPYRNHFVAGAKDEPVWRELVASGHARIVRMSSVLTGGDPCFAVTDKGRAEALAGLKLPKTSESQSEKP